MARRRNRSGRRRVRRNRRQVRKQTQPSGTRVVAPSVSQSRPSFGRIIANGVRQFVSYLPGASFLSSIADFGLKAYGLTSEVKSNQVKQSDGSVVHQYEVAAAENIALAGMFMVNYVNVILGSRVGVRTGWNSDKRQQLMLDYHEARLMSLCISVMPVGVGSKRSGEWTLSFAPFYESSDEAYYQGMTTSIPDDVSVKRFPYSLTSTASEPLSIRYRPRVSDGFAFQFHPPEINFGVIAIRIDQSARAVYSEFTGEDVAFDCIVSGRVELRSVPTYTSGAKTFSDKVDDVLKPIAQEVMCLSDGKQYTFKSGSRVVSRNGKVSVSGQIFQNYSELSLSDLELDDPP